MLYFQDEQAAKDAENTDVGKKHSETAALQDKLTGALIGLARVTDGNDHLINPSATAILVEGLVATQPNANFDSNALNSLLHRVMEEKRKMIPDCFACAYPCGKNNDYDMSKLRNADDEIRELKTQILFTVREVAAYAYRAALRGDHDDTIDRFFYKALTAIGIDELGMEDLLPVVAEADEVKHKCMALWG